MKIVHMSSAHAETDVRIFHKQCRSLAAHGYEVVYVVPSQCDKVVDGVRIKSVPVPASRLERMMSTVWSVYRAAIEEDADLYHFHDPELIPVALLLKWRSMRVVYDVHENLPQMVYLKYWLPGYLKWAMSLASTVLEFIAARQCDRIVAATNAISKRFPRSKTTYVANYPLTGEFNLGNPVPYSERPLTATFAGGITVMRCAREMVEAVHMVNDTTKIRLVLAGRFDPPDLEREIRSLPGWENIDYLGWQPRSKVADLLSSTRMGLNIVLPSKDTIDAEPNKLFEYMAAGIPVIASNFPLWRGIVEDNCCGVVVDPTDTNQIADAILWLTNHPSEAELMGNNGRQAVLAGLNWNTQFGRLLEVYNSVLG